MTHAIRTTLAAMLLAGSATLASPVPALSQPAASQVEDIAWTVSRDARNDGMPRLRIAYGSGSSSGFTLGTADSSLANARRNLAASGGEVSFSIVRDAGALECSGRLGAAYRGQGDCVFNGNPQFAAKLRVHGIALEGQSDLLAMALVGADNALVDGFVREGIAPRNAGELIAAAALDLSPGYIGELKRAGLVMETMNDAIACRALGVDGAFIRGLVAAGYRPTVQQAIAMKAVGVTPEYAREMNAAARRDGQ